MKISSYFKESNIFMKIYIILQNIFWILTLPLWRLANYIEEKELGEKR